MKVLQTIQKKRNGEQRGEAGRERRGSSEARKGYVMPNVIILWDAQLLGKLK